MLADYFASSTVDPWSVVIAIVIAIAGWIAASLAKKTTLKLVHRLPSASDAAAMLVARVVRYGLLLLTLGIVLTILGAPLQPVLAAVLIVVAVGVIALRGIAANFGAGVVIQARKVVHVGDEIEVVGFDGTVTELNGRSVVIHTADGRSVRLPNSFLLDNPLVNLTERGLCRSEIEVRVRVGDSFTTVGELIVSALESAERVRSVPGVQALVARRSPEESTFSVRFWHDSHHRAEVRSIAVSAIATALAGAGLEASVDWRVPPPPLTPPAAP